MCRLLPVLLALLAATPIAAQEAKPSSKLDPTARPQTPRPPYPYREVAVSFDNPSDARVSLAGSLTLPSSRGPFPAVLLVTGAGPQNRDYELNAHRPFQVLADHLTRLGIAVLRVDDRGVGGSTGSVQSASLTAIATDVAAGVRFLKSRDDIDVGRIGLIGHSLGGLIVPRLAARQPDVAFVVTMAGPVVSGVAFLAEQARLIALAAGASDDVAGERAAIQRGLMQMIRANPDDRVARIAIVEFFKERQRPAPGEDTIRALLSPDIRDLVQYEPESVLQQLDIPVLALFGGLDGQIPRLLNYTTAAYGLRRNPRATIVILPGLNHFFQTAETGLPDEYESIDETLSPRALDLIGKWIVQHTGL
ncbi:MAG: hypothetical protein A3G81_29060 [Betaproteobacteria bacterium RIFCSPLOWO2_12_FULL_65_14]|nr:MAG: hypothetical protein A3G81_29060 [Betaproteobacteria bacterium RIFCSPLOWO2_12_FULL_65_14]